MIEKFIQLVFAFPLHIEIKIGSEINEEDNERFWYMTIEEKPPMLAEFHERFGKDDPVR
jgi:hypothetical protein